MYIQVLKDGSALIKKNRRRIIVKKSGLFNGFSINCKDGDVKIDKMDKCDDEIVKKCFNGFGEDFINELFKSNANVQIGNGIFSSYLKKK